MFWGCRHVLPFLDFFIYVLGIWAQVHQPQELTSDWFKSSGIFIWPIVSFNLRRVWSILAIAPSMLPHAMETCFKTVTLSTLSFCSVGVGLSLWSSYEGRSSSRLSIATSLLLGSFHPILDSHMKEQFLKIIFSSTVDRSCCPIAVQFQINTQRLILFINCLVNCSRLLLTSSYD